ncbi:MAG: 2-succinyl-6-hydroxy-2,4-cyclohexadiene-1-carboxylate synthase [Candidatus Binatia bacterium]
MSEPSDDIPVLLLHGFLGCKDDWHDVATNLQSGRRLAVFDLPGHGAAEDAREDNDCSMDSACHRIEAVLEALEAPRGHIIGYSLGARTALYFAATRPGCVASLVLEGGSAGIEDEAERAARRSEDEGRAAALTRDGLEAFVAAWEELPLFATQKNLPAGVLAAQRARRLKNDADALARSLRHAGTGSQHWLGGHFHKINAPVLLIAGALDEKYANIAREMRAALPNARCAIVDGAGHNVHLEKTEEFVALVDGFLSMQDKGYLQ